MVRLSLPLALLGLTAALAAPVRAAEPPCPAPAPCEATAGPHAHAAAPLAAPCAEAPCP